MTMRFRLYLIAALVLLIAFALRVFDLGAKDISADEAFGVMMIQQPFLDLWRTGQDLHPPLYHALAWVVTRFAGESAFALRFAALIPGVLTVAVAVAITRRIKEWKTGLIAGALVAVSPALVYWSQDARLYTLLALTSAVSMWAFLRLSQRRRRIDWAIYLLATLAAMYTQYGAFWVIAAQNLFVLLGFVYPTRYPDWQAHRRIVWFAGQAALALAYLPWLLGQAAFVASPSTVGADGVVVSVERFLDAVGQIIRFSFVGYAPTEGAEFAIIVGLLLALISVCLGGRRWQALMGWWIVCTVVIVALTTLVLDYFDARFAIAAILPLCVLIALQMGGLIDYLGSSQAAINFRGLKLLFLGFIFILPIWQTFGLALLHWYMQPATAKSEYAAVMARIAAQWRDGDRILYGNPGQIALIFVHQPGALDGVLLDPLRVNSAESAPYIDEAIGDASRIWLFEYGDPAGFDAMRLVPDALSSRGLRALEWEYDSGKVTLYDLRLLDAAWQPLDALFGDAIRLAAYRLAVDDESARVSLLWEAVGTPADDYHVGVHILDDAGVLVAQTDALPRGGASRTVDWRAGDQIEDNAAVPLPPDLPPGTYHLRVVLYTFPALARLPVTGADGRGDMAALASFVR
jgi:4-amino-4-deoxy-L-arabinose transferase-like glycosyltransferase